MNSKGQTTLEFALTSLVVFSLVFVLVDLSVLLYVRQTVQYAVREGTRHAVTRQEKQNELRDALVRKIEESSNGLYDHLDPRHTLTVNVVTPADAKSFSNYSGTPVTDTGNKDEIIVVSLNYSWALLTPMVKAFFTDGNYNFTVRATMKNEQWDQKWFSGAVMKSRLCYKLIETTGQSIVELALVLPLLLMLLMGVVDVSRAIHAYSIIANMSREGASLASRTGINRQDIMDSVANTAQPLSMKDDGMMYVTEVDSNNNVKRQDGWQGRNEPKSAITGTGVAAEALGTIDRTSKDSFYIYEVFYQYHSLFIPNEWFVYAPELHSISVF